MAVAVPGTAFKSAVELAEEIKSKRVGCLELLEFFWERTTRFNPALNAIIASDMPAARTRARAADAAIARGQSWGVLHGVPMTIKDSFDVVGMPTTWGLPALKDNRPAQNAPVVDRFLGAGAVIFGKTNVPALLADWQTFNPDPWDVQQSMGRDAAARRLVRRRGGGAGRGPHRARNRQRHRRFDPQSCALLRHLRPQADLRHRAAARAGVPRQRRARGPVRRRPDGAQRRGSRRRAVGHRRPRRDRRARLAVGPRRTAAAPAFRFPRRRHLRRSEFRGRCRGAGSSAIACAVPGAQRRAGAPRRRDRIST